MTRRTGTELHCAAGGWLLVWILAVTTGFMGVLLSPALQVPGQGESPPHRAHGLASLGLGPFRPAALSPTVLKNS